MEERLDAICGHWKKGRIIAWTVMITGSLSYYLLVLKEFQSPDGYLEGFVLYHNAVWASANGRWLQRYLSLSAFNVVMPLFAVALYMFSTAVAVYLVVRLLHIEKNWNVIGISIVMTASPAVIEQLPYTYMAPAYSLALLFTVLYVYFNTECKRVGFSVFGGVFLCLAMGLYQSYVGVSVCLAVMMLIFKLMDEGLTVKWLRHVLRYMGTGIFGLVLYYVIMKIDVTSRSLVMSKRAREIDFMGSLAKFPKRFIYTYKCFFDYFLDWRIKRNVMYAVLFLILLIILAVAVFSFVRKKKWKEMFLFLILVALIPPAMNCVAFICTEDPIRNIMSYQMVLMIPFGMALLERSGKGKIRYLQFMAALLCSLIGWTYVISANITFRCWDLSNRRIHFVAENIVSDILAMPEYEDGKSIIVAGFIDDSTMRNRYWLLYAHAFEVADHVILWEGADSLRTMGEYLMLNFGIDAGTYTREEYYNIIDSDTFASMGVYPERDSIAEIDGMIVVKMSENPPR